MARTFQNIRLFPKMSVLENLMVAQHNRLMQASGWTIKGLLGLPGYRAAEREAVEFARFWLTQTELLDKAELGGGQSALWRPAPARDRARDVHAARRCCASTSPPPASTRANPRRSTSCCATSATRPSARCC